MAEIKRPIEKYNQLFPDAASKAAAFDKIAEKYYNMNFGSASKADIDVLMFSLYIEQILQDGDEDMTSYSDYTLSKDLGITQSKVSSLKVKKQLLYPHEDFNWQRALLRVCDRAVYENGKIKLFIPDKNVYLELKNAIEEAGGFIEVQLSSNLLQVDVEYFFDLMIAIDGNKNREQLAKEIKKKIAEQQSDAEFIDNPSIGLSLTRVARDVVLSSIESVLPCFSGARSVADKLWGVIKRARQVQEYKKSGRKET